MHETDRDGSLITTFSCLKLVADKEFLIELSEWSRASGGGNAEVLSNQ
jgi:hypothetical protein